MTRLLPLSLLSAAIAFLMAACNPPPDSRDSSEPGTADTITVGIGRVDITPDMAIRMSGYGNRTSLSQGVAGRLWAKALAIGSEDPVIIVTLDLIGVPKWLREQVVEELGIPASNIALCASHTHSGPHLRDVLNPIFMEDIPADHWAEIERYSDALSEKVVEACRAALASRVPGELSWGQGSVAFAGNRRVIENGKWTGFGIQPDGPVDHSLPVMRISDADGKLQAVFANYACHCTTLGGGFHEIHGDWAGEAQRLLEERHPGVSALIAIGCGADSNPNPRGSMEQVIAHGLTLADEVDRLLKTELIPLTHLPNTKINEIALPLDPLPSRAYWESHAKSDERTAYYAQQILKRLDAGESLPTAIDYPIQTWTFGEDLAMVFLAGEVVVDYSLKLKERFDADRIWINAYANAIPSYIASRRLYDEGGYEVDRSMYYYDKPTRLSPDTEDLVLDEVLKQLPHTFYSEETLSLIPAPISKEAALATMEIHPDLQIELVAAEPLVMDPIDIAWGPDGRLWVVEMTDYPLGLDGKGQTGGRIRFLEDANHDGVYDTATLFMENVSFPTSVFPWKDGVLVTAAPDLLFARDTNDDGKADDIKTLYTGFTLGNQQHLVNGMHWGLDGWIYLANGDSGGNVRSIATGHTVPIDGRDLRIRPETGEVEAVMGRTQFGRNRDSKGNWFGNSNSWPGWHFALEDTFLQRNPHVSYSNGRVFLPEEPQAGPVYPSSKTLSRFNDYERANRFTSACGLMIYDDPALGQAFVGNTFVAEPVHNLVSRGILYSENAYFRSKRAPEETESEFLRSTDNWFRPTAIRNGPDGALYVVDMYRFAIEHPEWIPEDWQRKLDLREGHDKGRIYRISRKGSPFRKTARLDALSPVQWVEKLNSDIRWERDQAQQLILDHPNENLDSGIRKIARNSMNPHSRIQALWTLQLRNALDRETLLKSLGDSSAAVRAQAVKLSHSHLQHGAILEKVVSLADDESGFVQIQVAYALGATDHSTASRALGELARQHAADPLIRSAILSSALPHQGILVEQLGTALLDTQNQPILTGLIQTALGSGNTDTSNEILRTILTQTGEYPIGNHIAAYRDYKIASKRVSPSIEGKGPRLSEELMEKEATLFRSIRTALADVTAPTDLRLDALKAIPFIDDASQTVTDLVTQCLGPRNPTELQIAAIDSLTSIDRLDAPQLLLDRWNQCLPSVRDHIIKTLLLRKDSTLKLLEVATQRPEIAKSLTAAQRNLLTRSRDESIRQAATAVFSADSNSDRQSVVETYLPALEIPGDPYVGRGLFANLCANCHQMDGLGVNVGPLISALSDKSPEVLLISILDPNRAVESKYHQFVATTQDGETAVGILSEETSNSVTLTTIGGIQQTLNRKALNSLESTALSLMPEGLESELNHEQMADLLAFLNASNESLRIRPNKQGELSLAANRAIVTGPSAYYNPETDAIEWIRQGDMIEWTAYDLEPGLYDIFGHAGLKDEHDGRPFTLHMNDTFVSGAVPYSRGMDRFRKRKFGNIEIDAKTPKAVFRLEHSLPEAEFALKELRLIPVK